MTIDQIIAAGDRVEFKRFIASASLMELQEAWVKASKARVQDFATLAFKELGERMPR